MLRRLLPWTVLVLLALPIGSCGSSGEECDRCTSDDECNSGLVCSNFSDGSRRCGTGEGISCKVR